MTNQSQKQFLLIYAKARNSRFSHFRLDASPDSCSPIERSPSENLILCQYFPYFRQSLKSYLFSVFAFDSN